VNQTESNIIWDSQDLGLPGTNASSILKILESNKCNFLSIFHAAGNLYVYCHMKHFYIRLSPSVYVILIGSCPYWVL
jgi:hypothetical protein